jgi:hypothetical protein
MGRKKGFTGRTRKFTGEKAPGEAAARHVENHVDYGATTNRLGRHGPVVAAVCEGIAVDRQSGP